MNPYLNHLALDLHLYETTSLPRSVVSWSQYDEDALSATERIWHFQAQGHARLGSCLFRGTSGILTKSFRLAPDTPFEQLWDGMLRQLVGFTRSVLIPKSDFEVYVNASLAGSASALRLYSPVDMDEVRLKIFLNLFIHLHSMSLMYRNHPTLLDKVASQRLEKITSQLKKLFDGYLHKSVAHELSSQAMVLAQHSFSLL